MSLPAKLVEHRAVEVADGIYAVVGGRVAQHTSARQVGQKLLAKRIARLVADDQCSLSASVSSVGTLLLFFPKPQQAINQVVSLCQPTEEGETPIAASFCIGEVEGPLHEESMLLKRAQALCEFAGGGQALFSNAAFEVLRDGDSGLASFHDLGTTQLDFQLRRERVYQLFHPELPSILASIPSEEREPKPLPHRFGMHIGREDQLTEIVGRINRFRLISVVGSGGIGKSHFASKVAHIFKEDTERTHDVIWVDLAGVNSEEQFLLAVAYALGLRTKKSPLLQRLLLGQLVNRNILFVFDGCDECRGPVRDFIEIALLSNGARFLVTVSRRLGLADESVCPLKGLLVPPSDETLLPEDLEEYESTALFLDRAKELKEPKGVFEPTQEDAEAIRRLCLRFDGHPLFIVLAAGKIKNLSPMEMLLDLQGIRARTVASSIHNPLHRHYETADDAVGWTFKNLTPDAQTLTKAIFPLKGAWSIRDAAAMADLLEDQTYELLQQLLDAGLVQIEETSTGGITYRLTAQIAPMIEKELATAEDRELYATRHRLIMIDKLASLAEDLTGANEVRALDKLELLRLDLEAAFQHMLRPGGDVEAFVDALNRSWGFWYKRNYIPEALTLVDLAAKRFKSRSNASYGRLLSLGGALATKAGQIDLALKYLDRAYAVGKATDNTHLLGISLANMGIAKWANGEFKAALRHFERAEPHVIAFGKSRNRYALYASWGTALMDAKQPEQAELIIAKAMANLEGQKDNLVLWINEVTRGQVSLRNGKPDCALEEFRHSVIAAQEVNDFASMARSLYWLAEVHFQLGNPTFSAQLLGAVRTSNRLSGIDLYPINEQRIASLEFKCWDALGDLAFSEAKFTGTLMEPEDVLEVVTGF